MSLVEDLFSVRDAPLEGLQIGTKRDLLTKAWKSSHSKGHLWGKHLKFACKIMESYYPFFSFFFLSCLAGWIISSLFELTALAQRVFKTRFRIGWIWQRLNDIQRTPLHARQRLNRIRHFKTMGPEMLGLVNTWLPPPAAYGSLRFSVFGIWTAFNQACRRGLSWLGCVDGYKQRFPN